MSFNSRNPSQCIAVFGEGDILGLSSLFEKQTYAMDAVEKEGFVLYAISIENFKILLVRN